MANFKNWTTGQFDSDLAKLTTQTKVSQAHHAANLQLHRQCMLVATKF